MTDTTPREIRRSEVLMPYDPERHGPKRLVGPGFHAQVYEVVRRVPKGRVTTYGDVGTQLGSSRVARHVGFALAALGESDESESPQGLAGESATGSGSPRSRKKRKTRKRSSRVPWHRVVNSKGQISFALDDIRGQEQVRLLAREGITVNDSGRIVGFHQLRW